MLMEAGRDDLQTRWAAVDPLKFRAAPDSARSPSPSD